MHVIIGGAYSGKRQFVKKQISSAQWISAYDDKIISEEMITVENGTIVLEGFEIWIAHYIQSGKSNLEICALFDHYFDLLTAKCDVYIIMLEVGRGVVPIEVESRRLRDIMGWIQQSAVKKAEKATYMWHGLSQRLK